MLEKRKFEQAIYQGNASETPVVSEDTPGADTSINPNNMHRYTRKQKITASVVGGLVVLGAAGAGMFVASGYNNSKNPAKPIESSAPANPDTTQPAESLGFKDKRDNFERSVALPAELAPLKLMSLSDFELQSKPQQKKYASYLGQYRPAYEAWFHRVSGEEIDTPVTITPASTPEQIYQAHIYNLRISASMELSDAEKYLVAHYDGNEETNPYLKIRLNDRRGQTIKSNSFNSKSPGDAIPASALALGSGFGGSIIGQSTASTFLNAEGSSVNGFIYSVTVDGAQWDETLYTEQVNLFDGSSDTEVFLKSIQPINK